MCQVKVLKSLLHLKDKWTMYYDLKFKNLNVRSLIYLVVVASELQLRYNFFLSHIVCPTFEVCKIYN